jgi:ABC-type transport system substrate-binding protein
MDLTRRAFLHTLANMGGAAAAAGLLAACGTTAPPAVPAAATTTSPQSAAPTAAPAAAAAPKKGGTLKVSLASDIIGIDPHGASAGVDRFVYTSIYNGLVAPDKNLNIVPDLAESWTTPDPKTYVFKLRPNVKSTTAPRATRPRSRRTSTGSWTPPTPLLGARRSSTSSRSPSTIR